MSLGSCGNCAIQNNKEKLTTGILHKKDEKWWITQQCLHKKVVWNSFKNKLFMLRYPTTLNILVIALRYTLTQYHVLARNMKNKSKTYSHSRFFCIICSSIPASNLVSPRVTITSACRSDIICTITLWCSSEEKKVSKYRKYSKISSTTPQKKIMCNPK